MNYENVSPEQQEKAKACKGPEELAAIAEEEGFELSDEMLEGVAGGGFDPSECKRYRHICSQLTIHHSEDERLGWHGFQMSWGKRQVARRAKKEGYKLSDEEIEAVAGGSSWCLTQTGDSREDVDPDLAHADFVNGAVDGGENW